MVTSWRGEAKARLWGSPVPGHLAHGPGSHAGQVYGCDCKLCLPSGKRRPANGEGKPQSVRQREMRNRKWGTPVPPGLEHGVYVYNTYGCRCEICGADKVARQRRARERQQAEERSRWRGHWYDDLERGITVVHWPPAALEETWQCPLCDYKEEVPA